MVRANNEIKIEDTHVFYNLTNGLEGLSDPLFFGCKSEHFIRIRSTTIERKDWLFLLMDLDHNFLMHLALGKPCLFVDYGTNKLNSKTCYMGIPFISYVLKRLWWDIDEDAPRYKRHNKEEVYDSSWYFRDIYNQLLVYDKTSVKDKLKTKLKYYKRFVSKEKPLDLQWISYSTDKDNDYDYFVNLVKDKYES